MTKVEWVSAGEGWVDLIDATQHGTSWCVTYRKRGSKWVVLYPSNTESEYVPTNTTSEEELRHRLRLEYLLTRSET